MSSNLPPGCSSPDGGIDHALESALDDLCSAIETPEEAVVLQSILPALRHSLNAAYQNGVQEGRMDEQQRAEMATDGLYK